MSNEPTSRRHEQPPTKQGERISKERAEFLLQWISDKAQGGFGPMPAEIEFLLREYLTLSEITPTMSQEALPERTGTREPSEAPGSAGVAPLSSDKPGERLRDFLLDGCDARPEDRYDALKDLESLMQSAETCSPGCRLFDGNGFDWCAENEKCLLVERGVTPRRMS